LVKKLRALMSTMYSYSTRFKIFTVMLLWIQDLLDFLPFIYAFTDVSKNLSTFIVRVLQFKKRFFTK